MMDRVFIFLADLIVPLPNIPTDNKLQVIFNIVLSITGAITVLIVVLAGFRYIISQGNPQELTKARNTIIYALVGLVVVMFAFAIVNFVIGGIT